MLDLKKHNESFLLKEKHDETVALLTKQSQEHRMRLNPEPFRLIADGQKTIEMRIYDEKRRKVKPGDTIVFTNIADNTQKLRATVVKLHVFPTFAELYQNLPLPLCGYTADELPTAYFTDMERYYSAEVQIKYGVVGIELSAPEELPEEAE